MILFDSIMARYEWVVARRREGWTFSRIARELDISPSRAGQLHARAVEKIREKQKREEWQVALIRAKHLLREADKWQ